MSMQSSLTLSLFQTPNQLSPFASGSGSQSLFWTKILMNLMVLSFRVAVARKLTPTSSSNFLLWRGVSFSVAIVVALSVLSVIADIISSLQSSNWLIDVVGGASLGDVFSVSTCWGSTLLTQYSYCSLTPLWNLFGFAYCCTFVVL